MRIQNRLIFLLICFLILVAVGRASTGGFEFLLTQFWFTAGFFLLLLLSLVDQPYFSKDANVFVNATTAWVSLLLIGPKERGAVWWSFLAWASYLIVSSYVLMWLRSRELRSEKTAVQLTSRVNRQIGRPEALFSAFFLWGCIQQFGATSPKLGPLFLFWAIFMILNLPAIATAIDQAFATQHLPRSPAGTVTHIISPRIAQVAFAGGLPRDLAGRKVTLNGARENVLAEGVVIDDRIVAGIRVGRVALTTISESWQDVGSPDTNAVRLELQGDASKGGAGIPISVVDAGSEVGKLVLHAHPNQPLQTGEVLWVQKDTSTKAYYQIISAIVCQLPLPDGNFMHTVKVTAGQLGVWDEHRCRFEAITWVAPAGELVHRATLSITCAHQIPSRHQRVGQIPNSDFPVHISVEDAITHNTAIIGVTGSGKSYLAFDLIEAMLRCGIRVLILDISRQHDLHLIQQGPTALRTTADVKPWLDGESLIGIHQFGVDAAGYPRVTSEFVTAAFNEVSTAKLERGKDVPAKLCIVLEEAHSLIPEWNQVAQRGDEQFVNKTARVILQGRKYGMGSLIITQRTANVTKTILNQCNTIFALQSFDQTGLDFLRNYMGEEYSHAISTLPSRHAILVGKASSSARPLVMQINDLSDRWTEITAKPPKGTNALGPDAREGQST